MSSDVHVRRGGIAEPLPTAALSRRDRFITLLASVMISRPQLNEALAYRTAKDVLDKVEQDLSLNEPTSSAGHPAARPTKGNPHVD